MDLIIIGLGQFGSALAQMYKRQGRRVHKIIGPQTKVTLTKSEVSKSIILLCVPTQSLSEVLEQRVALLSTAFGVVSAAKGLVRKTGQTATEYLRSENSSIREVFALSGPSFASEIKKKQPTALVLAGENETPLNSTIKILGTSQVRLYKSLDPLGVELCGALKNVYAIAAGVSAGLRFGDNTRAALNTRALAEMSRITKALGAHPFTVFGLAGVGDLFLTCSSQQSRNFQFGFGLARGKTQKSLFRKLGTVEGAWTAASARKVCRKHGLRTPLIDAVSDMLEGRLLPKDAIKSLMVRQVRHEFE